MSIPDYVRDRAALQRLLDRWGVPTNAYELDPLRVGAGSTLVDDVVMIAPVGRRWAVWYRERGKDYDLREFETESLACLDMAMRLRRLLGIE
ncbi:hypothetical protein GCM10022222_16170 [Amycolatopsis ultiminotia]|uniref:Uncharacterized protein n=1 Tax=Amycolatopsis ultiminotia TaxID=543629 RepID=A0ABP6VD84_9PSEU